MNKSYMPWFEWNGENSYANGLWIKKLPPIIRAEERRQDVIISGRAGALTLTEGKDIYDSYLKEVVVTTVNTNHRLQHVLDWLRGDGELVMCNEDQYVYKARIAGTVKFERDGNDFLVAKIPFFVQPFKHEKHPDSVTSSDASWTLYNPGNVASRPIVHITRSGNTWVKIGGIKIVFTHISGTIDIDCDAGIITQDGAAWPGSGTGTYTIEPDEGYEADFWWLEPGNNEITRGNECTVRIEPRWRWV